MALSIGVLFEDDLESGGGYQQSRSALEQICRLWPAKDVVVYCTKTSVLSELRKQGYEPRMLRTTMSDRLVAFLSSSFYGIRALRRLGILGSMERQFVSDGIDLLYFLSLSVLPMSLLGIPYVYTLWDLCHRDNPWFPEVLARGEFRRRESQLAGILPQAALVLVESQELATRIQTRYGIDQEKCLIMPLFPSRSCGQVELSKQESEIVEQVKAGGDYFFYPAQYWPHKNHIRILQALLRLKKNGTRARVVFAGGDRDGVRKYLEDFAGASEIVDQVTHLGFVSDCVLSELWRKSYALVMPTYFGPTNLPPVEAWQAGKPVIYSRNFVSMWDSGILAIDPDSVESLAEAMKVLMNIETYKEFILKGREQLERIIEYRKLSEIEFVRFLSSMESRRECWPKNL